MTTGIHPVPGAIRPPPTELWLIRHAESEGNASGVLQGQEDLALSERGRRQAARLGARLAALHREHPFSTLITSDLERAQETAQIVGGILGLTPASEPRLKEIDVGVWSGLTTLQIQERYPEEWATWQSRDPTMRRGGGESYQDVQLRVTPVLAELAARHPHRRVLVITHGGVLRSYLSHVLGMPLRHLWHIGMANTGISRVRPFETAVGGSQPRRGRVVCLNDTAHLDADGVAAEE